MKYRKVLGMVAVAGIALATAWFLFPCDLFPRDLPQPLQGRFGPAGTPRNGALAQGSSTAAAATGVGTVTNGAQVGLPIVLPPINTPLKQVYAGLKARAIGGNPNAACRLAFELDRCTSLPDRIAGSARNAERVQARLRTDTDPRRRALFEGYQEDVRRELAIASAACAGFVPDKDERQAWEYLLAAARAGHEPSAVRYVAGGSIGLDMERPLQTLDGWVTYRAEAPAIAERSIRAGSPEVYQWVAFSSVAGWYGMSLTPRDPIRAVALYLALRDRATPRYAAQLDRTIAALSEREKLSPDDLLGARTMSVELASQLKPSAEGIDLSQGTFPSEDGSHCEK